MKMRNQAATSLVLAAVVSTILTAQSPSMEFEAASIKSNRSDAPGVGGLGFAPGGIRARNQSPVRMLQIAVGVQPDQIVGAPSWAANEGFDINARVGPNVVFNPMTMLGPMLLNLLTYRFQLKTHHE